MLVRPDQLTLTIGDAVLTPVISDGEFRSLGAVKVGGASLRNPVTRFLPWFDTFEGDVFRKFRFAGIEQRGHDTVITTRAISDPDVMFRERRDSSGDLCFREISWDAEPLEADFRICLAPAATTIDGRAFTGFRYWFEYASATTPIHRIVDRQTWEVGGNLDDVTVCLRNWLTKPRLRVTRNDEYSTVGLHKMFGLLPGNLWGRWTLLPSFDMQYGQAGIMLGWFDQVSLIRTVIETNPGEDYLRCMDMHAFEQGLTAATNPKTVLWCPDRLDDVDALNLWTRVHDMEQEKACRQFGIQPQLPPQLVNCENKWVDLHWDRDYETVMDVSAEFGLDYFFIDPVWENEQTWQETIRDLVPTDTYQDTVLSDVFQECQCATIDFRIAKRPGGEIALKALCDRAAAKGLKVVSWIASHYSSDTALGYKRPELGHGINSIFAAKESGRHPDTGYASGCWTLNFNAPIGEYVKQQILDACERTGLAGFLWDSFCNLGWWQVDYSNATMRPQYDKMAQMYADLSNAGLYIMPEALVTFSNGSMCGLHGGNVYEGDLLGYSYNSNIALGWGGMPEGHYFEHDILRGKEPIDLLFQCIAHKRAPLMTFHRVPREEWEAQSAAAMQELFAMYKAQRHLMQKRTVLHDDAGVLWENETDQSLLFAFADFPWAASAVDAATGDAVTDGVLQKNRAYVIDAKVCVHMK